MPLRHLYSCNSGATINARTTRLEESRAIEPMHAPIQISLAIKEEYI